VQAEGEDREEEEERRETADGESKRDERMKRRRGEWRDRRDATHFGDVEIFKIAYEMTTLMGITCVCESKSCHALWRGPIPANPSPTIALKICQ
jgi:hypothetical protein